MSEPLVSIFLPTYNQEDYIGESIESALEQDYENIEIVIGDDCSQDSTWDIIQSYKRNHPDAIKSFRNESNLGVTANCNEVLQRCTGKYVAFHAGDDILLPGKIRRQVEVLEANTSCILCYHDVENFDSNTGEVISYWNSGSNGREPITGDATEVARQVVAQRSTFFAPMSVMLYRNKLPPQGYDERVSGVSDWLLWVTYCMENSGCVRFINDVLSRRRIHDANISNDLEKYTSDQGTALAIVEEKYPELHNSVSQYRGYLKYRQGVEAINNNEFDLGRRLMLEHTQHSIYSWKWIGWWILSWLKQYNIIQDCRTS